jgi:hypothetical protein
LPGAEKPRSSATSVSGGIMMQPDALGKLQAGYIADIVLIDGTRCRNCLSSPIRRRSSWS